MSQSSASQFLDAIQSNRLLDDARIDELRSRPEATWGDVSSLANYAQERGWLTAYQTQELEEGRGSRLTVFGYQIFDKLEDGPAGPTYKALHPALQQPVTLHIIGRAWLAPADTPADYIARLQAASIAQNQHLVSVLDAGPLNDGAFVVQEFVDGCDLFRFVNEMGALPVGRACEYARQTAIALAAAHQCGVAHGAVSPHTMLLTPVTRAAGSNGDISILPRQGASIKLADLALTPRRPPLGELTFGESDRLGAIAFYPPERLTSSDIARPGDIYGLGASLYFLLTTRPPHAGDSPLATLLDLQKAEPTPLEAIKPDLPPAMTDLVRRLLSRDPSVRPSAAEVAEAITPYCDMNARPTPHAAGGVLLASETGSHQTVPTAVPVARNLDQLETQLDMSPIAEELPNTHPLVEPLDSQYNGVGLMPEIQPLDASGDHLSAFGHSALGADSPRIARPKTKATGKNKLWIIAGLCLHLSAVILLIGYLTNWFAFSHSQEPPDRKTHSTPTKIKGRRG